MAERAIYGKPEPRYASTMAGVWVESHSQAKLLQRVIERGMADFAGRHEETFLAKCFNDLEATIAQAKRENWIGWEESYPAIPAALARPEDGGRNDG